ncbi:MAG: IS66 family transposase [Gammaproteobacteria bacterium]
MKEPEPVKLTAAEGEALIQRIKANQLKDEDRQVLEQLIHMYFWLLFVVQEAKLSLKRLKRLIFGGSDPPKPPIQPPKDPPTAPPPAGTQASTPAADPVSEPTEERDAAGRRKRGGGKPPGQGRHGAETYRGAERILCTLDEVQAGQRCLACGRGTWYRLPPGVEIRMDGNGFLTALRYELEKLRCSACGQIYTAPLPAEAGPDKYSASARAVLALGRYYLGLPFNRLEGYQQLIGVPVSDATQWDQIEQLAGCVWPVFNELVYQAAQGELLYEDDTPVRVLSMIQENTTASADERRGMYTTGVVALVDEHEIWLYFSGRAHAGENVGALLQQREAEAAPLMLMSDALSANRLDPAPAGNVIRCFCLAHGLRQFSDLEDAFPEPVGHVLKVLDQVFEHDRTTRERQLTPAARLQYHQQHSGPLLDALHPWLEGQLEDREVEPNSSLGKAFRYLLTHWQNLTQFLRVASAPIDNNVVERALKLMIRQRRNSLFFASAYSAQVGSVLCSVIATALKAGVNVLDYLVALQRHRDEVLRHPSRWLPWQDWAALATP